MNEYETNIRERYLNYNNVSDNYAEFHSNKVPCMGAQEGDNEKRRPKNNLCRISLKKKFREVVLETSIEKEGIRPGPFR